MSYSDYSMLHLYVLRVCYLQAVSEIRIIQSSIPCQYAIFTFCQYASNHPIFYYRPVCYLYVLQICYLDALSKLRTSQSSIPGLYAIYTYCKYAIYMLLQSFEPPNLPFPASMLSIRIASMPCTCCFEASNHPIFYFLPVCYLYVLPVCHVHAASKLRTTQSSIPGQCAIYKYCQYAIYMLLRSFEPPNLTFPASMLSIRIASMPRTCCFEAPNLPFLASMLTIFIASILFTCCFEQPNLPFPASVRSTSIASMLFTRCFEASNHPIFHSRQVCYLYVLPVCYLHVASNHPMDGYIFPVWQSVTKHQMYCMHVHSTPASTLSPRNVRRQFLIAICTAFSSSNCQTFCTPVYGAYRGTGKL